MAVDAGRISRLLVTMPPRHGKTELAAIRFPAWFLGRNPDRRIIVTSYGSDLAERISRQVRGVVASDRFRAVFPEASLSHDSASVAAWDLQAPHRGGLKAAGVGGPITGFGADLLIVDDPHKNREEADSQRARDAVWEWFTSVAYTRLEPGGRVLVIQTRWHEDDLAGRLLRDGGEELGRWKLLHLPAIADGLALWPERYPVSVLQDIRRTIGEYDWASLYMGTPSPREGSLFKLDRIEIVSAAPAGLPAVRAWDVAATVGAGDYTAGVLMAGPNAEGLYWILDVVRGQWGTEERNRIMRQTAAVDGRDVLTLVPQDPGSAGVDAAKAFIRTLAGYRVQSIRVSGDKVLRADPLSAQVNAGNVRMLRGEWNRDLLEELRTFPLGRHDDQVDAAADAFAALTRRRRMRAY